MSEYYPEGGATLPWYPADDEDEPMSLEEEVGYPVSEEDYLDSQALDREIWPLYDDDGNVI